MCVRENHMDEHAFMCVICMCATAQTFFIVCFAIIINCIMQYTVTTLNCNVFIRKEKKRKKRKKKEALVPENAKKYSDFRIKG